MAKKMSRGLVTLSSSAITAIYVAGFFATQGADAGLGPPQAAASPEITSPAAGPTRPAPALAIPPLPTAVPAPIVGQTRPSVPVLAPTTGAAYHDGTFQGSGTSRRGGVSVAVTIADGRITDVKFTQVTTQYPVSRIASLPAQVVSRQGAQVDRISGATYSVQAFQGAVQQALARAQAAGASAAA